MPQIPYHNRIGGSGDKMKAETTLNQKQNNMEDSMNEGYLPDVKQYSNYVPIDYD